MTGAGEVSKRDQNARHGGATHAGSGLLWPDWMGEGEGGFACT
jgi:hypothetical protein